MVVKPTPSDGEGRTIPSSIVVVPGGDVTVDGEFVCWTFDLDSAKFAWKEPSGWLVDDFLLLWQKDDEAIREFCETWGPLRKKWEPPSRAPSVILSQHGHPISRAARESAERRVISGRDSVAEWRFLSRRICAINSLSIDLRDGRNGSEEDWKLLGSGDSPAAPGDFWGCANWALTEVACRDGVVWGRRIGVGQARRVLAGEVNDWIRRFPFTLNLKATPAGNWAFEVEYYGCFLNVIAYQLALRVGNADLFRCSGCKTPYLRSRGRKPKQGVEANYCAHCFNGKVDLHRADERRRGRMRRALKMHSMGLSPAEIAKKLKMTRSTATKTVQSWISKRKIG